MTLAFCNPSFDMEMLIKGRTVGSKDCLRLVHNTYTTNSVTCKKSPNAYKSCLKMISLEKLKMV